MRNSRLLKYGFIVALVVSLLSASLAGAQSAPPTKPKELLVKAPRLLDVRTGSYQVNVGVWIENDQVKQVGPATELALLVPKDAKVIDLGQATILPGLIDCHTHMMLREPKDPDGYALNLLTKSEAFRALE